MLLSETHGLKSIPFSLPMKPIYPSELHQLKKAYSDTCYQEKIQCLLLQEINDPVRLLETAKVKNRQKLREVTQLTECQALMECWVHLSRSMKRTKVLRCFPVKKLLKTQLVHLSFSESGTFLLAISTGLEAFVFDIEDLKTTYEFSLVVGIGQDSFAKALVTNNGEHVIVATTSGRLISFFSEDGSIVNEDSHHLSLVTSLRANEAATQVAVGYDDSLIRLLTLPGLSTLIDLKKQYIEIRDICLFDGILGSIDKSGHTLYWDIERSLTVERLVLTGIRQYFMRGPQIIGLMESHGRTVVRTVNCVSKQDREYGDAPLGASVAMQLGEDMRTLSYFVLSTGRYQLFDLGTGQAQEVAGPGDAVLAAINPSYPLLSISTREGSLELWALEWELEQV